MDKGKPFARLSQIGIRAPRIAKKPLNNGRQRASAFHLFPSFFSLFEAPVLVKTTHR